MDKLEFLTRLARILELESLTENDSIKPVTWDSIEVLATIALVDEAGKTVRIADLQRCQIVGDLLALAGVG